MINKNLGKKIFIGLMFFGATEFAGEVGKGCMLGALSATNMLTKDVISAIAEKPDKTWRESVKLTFAKVAERRYSKK